MKDRVFNNFFLERIDELVTQILITSGVLLVFLYWLSKKKEEKQIITRDKYYSARDRFLSDVNNKEQGLSFINLTEYGLSYTQMTMLVTDLIEKKIIEKKNGLYILTDHGKQYYNLHVIRGFDDSCYWYK